MAGFDPDRHSLSDTVRLITSSRDVARIVLGDDYDRLVKTLNEEFGFQIDEAIHVDDLRELVEADRSGLRKTWSSWRQFDEDTSEEQQRYEIAKSLENVNRFDVDPGIGVLQSSRDDSRAGGVEPVGKGGGGSGEFSPAPLYRVIYADAPWTYRNKKTGGSHKSGSVQQYRVMTLEEIKNLPIWKLAHPEGCVLFSWGTIPMPREALDTMEAWGFEYKTRYFWKKLGRLGMGFWLRGQIEELLIGVRGPVKAFRWQEINFKEARRRDGLHSGKPVEIRAKIEEITSSRMPNGGIPRIELFSREVVPGWDHWGDEVGGPVRLVNGEWVVPKREGVKA